MPRGESREGRFLGKYTKHSISIVLGPHQLLNLVQYDFSSAPLELLSPDLQRQCYIGLEHVLLLRLD